MYDKDKTQWQPTPHHILYGCSELPGHCRIQGLSVRAAYSNKSIAAAKEFHHHDDDVVIASYPRAGAILVQEIVYQLQHKDALLGENTTDRMPCLEYHGRATCVTPTGVRKAGRAPPPRVLKTHLPASFIHKAVTDDVKLIYVMRNPKDLCSSYYEFYKGFRLWGNWSFNTFQQLFFNTDKLGFGNYFDHCLSYWQERARANILIVFYEDIVRNKRREVQKIAKFLNAELTGSDLSSIIESTSFESMKDNQYMNPLVYERNTAQVKLDYDFYARGSIGYWREYFTDEQDREYDDIIRARMTSEGVYFNYGNGQGSNSKGAKSERLSLCDQCGAKLDQKCMNEGSRNRKCYFKAIDF